MSNAKTALQDKLEKELDKILDDLNLIESQRIIYMDNAATSYVDSYARLAEFNVANICRNASSQHFVGENTAKILKKSREMIAECLNCKPDEIFFTSGGTESNNWVVNSALNNNRKTQDGKFKGFITSNIEHHSILNTAARLPGTHIIKAKGNFLDPADVVEYIESIGEDRFSKDGSIISIMLANNETGAIQPVSLFADVAHKYGWLMHTDAVQAVGHIPVDVKELGVDMLSLSGHKFGASKGIGALYIKKEVQSKVVPFMYGGHQEYNLRAGTQNVTGAFGMAFALQNAQKNMTLNETFDTCGYVENLRHSMENALSKIPDVFFVNTLGSAKWKELSYLQPDVPSAMKAKFFPDFLPGIVSVCFKGVEAERLVMELSMNGICVSQGSACMSDSIEPSHVLLAAGMTDEEAKSTIRISLSEYNVPEEVEEVASVISRIVEQIRKENKENKENI